MAERIKMGLVGCGGMSGAHMKGYEELWSKGLRDFEIVAACDIVIRTRRRTRESGTRISRRRENRQSIQNLMRCWRNTRIWRVLTFARFTVYITRLQCLRSMLENMLSLKNRSASQCGHAN